jgi:adenosylcobinamide kinase / adenosylcobinamide-phosphate guanylyltransferase
MRVLVRGSGGLSGWPQPGCRCASCLRAADGRARGRSAIVIDDAVTLGVRAAIGADGGAVDAADAPDAAGAPGGGPEVRELADAAGPGLGGWEVTAADGTRLLYPARPGAVPVPVPQAAPYQVAFLDLLGDPVQLGGLRARGLVSGETITAVAFADHRAPSEAELQRRCGFWRVALPGDGDQVTTGRSANKDWRVRGGRVPWRVLVLGGARSGKSERAELRLAGEPDVTYVAAGGAVSTHDAEWAARVAAHRARRPSWWRTAETTDLAGVLATARGAVLIDGIGTWLAAVLDECGAWDGGDLWAARLAGRTAELVQAWRQTGARVVAVSDEAGLGVVPGTHAGRLFRDELGRLNQVLAAESEETELVVAGRALSL